MNGKQAKYMRRTVRKTLRANHIAMWNEIVGFGLGERIALAFQLIFGVKQK